MCFINKCYTFFFFFRLSAPGTFHEYGTLFILYIFIRIVLGAKIVCFCSEVISTNYYLT